ncbi:MAG TPA: sugar phosphate isomerase/epimerase family protein [Candidatus Brocadiia bacterium]|nr:sugar phosphate isomerase/epimerase family protein [Candidatus Brocadiia bacterium]
MKKGICIGSLPGGMGVLDKFKLAKEAGFDGIEPGTLQTDENLLEVKYAATETGLQITSIMNMAHWSSPFSSADPAEVQKGLDGARRSIECASALGAGAVLIVPAVVNEGVTYEEAYARSQEQIKKLLPMAAEKKIVIAIENVWNKFLLSPIEFARYIDEFNSPWAKAYFDVGNILLYGFPQHWIKSLGTRIARIHLKDFKVGPKSFVNLTEGDLNWSAVMAALKSIGYEGYLTAEVGVVKEDPVGGVHKLSRTMDKILAM